MATGGWGVRRGYEGQKFSIKRFAYDVLYVTLSKCGYPKSLLQADLVQENDYCHSDYVITIHSAVMSIAFSMRDKWKRMFEHKHKRDGLGDMRKIQEYLTDIEELSEFRTDTLDKIRRSLAIYSELILFLHSFNIAVNFDKILHSWCFYFYGKISVGYDPDVLLEALFIEGPNIVGYLCLVDCFIEDFAIPYGEKDDISRRFGDFCGDVENFYDELNMDVEKRTREILSGQFESVSDDLLDLVAAEAESFYSEILEKDLSLPDNRTFPEPPKSSDGFDLPAYSTEEEDNLLEGMKVGVDETSQEHPHDFEFSSSSSKVDNVIEGEKIGVNETYHEREATIRKVGVDEISHLSEAASMKVDVDERSHESEAVNTKVAVDERSHESEAASTKVGIDDRSHEREAASTKVAVDERSHESEAGSTKVAIDERSHESEAASTKVGIDERSHESEAASTKVGIDERSHESEAASTKVGIDERSHESEAASTKVGIDDRSHESEAASTKAVANETSQESDVSSRKVSVSETSQESEIVSRKGIISETQESGAISRKYDFVRLPKKRVWFQKSEVEIRKEGNGEKSQENEVTRKKVGIGEKSQEIEVTRRKVDISETSQESGAISRKSRFVRRQRTVSSQESEVTRRKVDSVETSLDSEDATRKMTIVEKSLDREDATRKMTIVEKSLDSEDATRKMTVVQKSLVSEDATRKMAIVETSLDSEVASRKVGGGEKSEENVTKSWKSGFVKHRRILPLQESDVASKKVDSDETSHESEAASRKVSVDETSPKRSRGFHFPLPRTKDDANVLEGKRPSGFHFPSASTKDGENALEGKNVDIGETLLENEVANRKVDICETSQDGDLSSRKVGSDKESYESEVAREKIGISETPQESRKYGFVRHPIIVPVPEGEVFRRIFGRVETSQDDEVTSRKVGCHKTAHESEGAEKKVGADEISKESEVDSRKVGIGETPQESRKYGFVRHPIIVPFPEGEVFRRIFGRVETSQDGEVTSRKVGCHKTAHESEGAKKEVGVDEISKESEVDSRKVGIGETPQDSRIYGFVRLPRIITMRRRNSKPDEMYAGGVWKIKKGYEGQKFSVKRFAYDMLYITLSKCGYPKTLLHAHLDQENDYSHRHYVITVHSAIVCIALTMRDTWKHMFEYKQKGSVLSDMQKVDRYLRNIEVLPDFRTDTLDKIRRSLAFYSELILFLHSINIEIDFERLLNVWCWYFYEKIAVDQDPDILLEAIFIAYPDILGYQRLVDCFIQDFATPYGEMDVSEIFHEFTGELLCFFSGERHEVTRTWNREIHRALVEPPDYTNFALFDEELAESVAFFAPLFEPDSILPSLWDLPRDDVRYASESSDEMLPEGETLGDEEAMPPKREDQMPQ